HIATREAAIALANTSGIPLCLYAEQPYATQYGWPHWVTGTAPVPHLHPDARWPDAFVDSAVKWDSLEPHVTMLDGVEVKTKIAAMECYRSQSPALNAGPLDRLRHPQIVHYELRWDVT